MQINYSQRRNVSPEQAVALLSKEGITISLEEAEAAVDFLYFLAEIFTNEITEE